jgi:hypothetical protein
MAKLRVQQQIVNDNFKFLFTIDPESISDTDYLLVRKFGQPSIDFGGSFTNGTQMYTMPSNYYDFPNDFPVCISFSGTVPFDVTVEANLDLYRTTMVTRITSAITTLRSTTDNFSNEFITVI